MRIGSGIASQMARFPKGSSHDWVKRVDSMPGRLPKSRLDSVLVNHAGRPESRPIEAPSSLAQPSPGRVKRTEQMGHCRTARAGISGAQRAWVTAGTCSYLPWSAGALTRPVVCSSATWDQVQDG